MFDTRLRTVLDRAILPTGWAAVGAMLLATAFVRWFRSGTGSRFRGLDLADNIRNGVLSPSWGVWVALAVYSIVGVGGIYIADRDDSSPMRRRRSTRDRRERARDVRDARRSGNPDLQLGGRTYHGRRGVSALMRPVRRPVRHHQGELTCLTPATLVSTHSTPTPGSA